MDSPKPSASSRVEVEDVFVSLDGAIKLLTSVSGQTMKVTTLLALLSASLPPAGKATQHQDSLDNPSGRAGPGLLPPH